MSQSMVASAPVAASFHAPSLLHRGPVAVAPAQGPLYASMPVLGEASGGAVAPVAVTGSRILSPVEERRLRMEEQRRRMTERRRHESQLDATELRGAAASEGASESEPHSIHRNRRFQKTPHHHPHPHPHCPLQLE